MTRAPFRSDAKPNIFWNAGASRAVTLTLVLGLLPLAAFAQGEGAQSAAELAGG